MLFLNMGLYKGVEIFSDDTVCHFVGPYVKQIEYMSICAFSNNKYSNKYRYLINQPNNGIK